MTYYADFEVSIALSRQEMKLEDRSREQEAPLAPEMCRMTRFEDQESASQKRTYPRTTNIHDT